jgi:hypothetical protein
MALLMLMVLRCVACASLRFDPFFQDDMVLQCNDNDAPSARIWGYSIPSQSLTATLTQSRFTKTYYLKADGNGFWSIQLSVPASNRSYSFRITTDGSKESLALHRILFGEVYLCSGKR